MYVIPVENTIMPAIVVPLSIVEKTKCTLKHIMSNGFKEDIIDTKKILEEISRPTLIDPKESIQKIDSCNSEDIQTKVHNLLKNNNLSDTIEQKLNANEVDVLEHINLSDILNRELGDVDKNEKDVDEKDEDEKDEDEKDEDEKDKKVVDEKVEVVDEKVEVVEKDEKVVDEKVEVVDKDEKVVDEKVEVVDKDDKKVVDEKVEKVEVVDKDDKKVVDDKDDKKDVTFTSRIRTIKCHRPYLVDYVN